MVYCKSGWCRIFHPSLHAGSGISISLFRINDPIMKAPITVVLLCVITFLGCRDPREEVFRNYKTHGKEIFLARDHFIGMMPRDLLLYIRFEEGDLIDFKLDQLNYKDSTSWNKSQIFDRYGQFQRFGVDMNIFELRGALKLINLTVDDLKQLRQRLKKANCISASNYSSFQSYPESAYISIGFPTDDLYSLDYNIFWYNLDSKDITEMAKACNIKKVNDQVLVRYTGPSIGSDCFPDKR